jgi:hypothetical protein
VPGFPADDGTVKPKDRIPMITRCAEALSGHNWVELDMILGEHRIPTLSTWNGDKYDYGIAMLQQADDEQLVDIHDYFFGTIVADESLQPWAPGHFRLFLSHIAREKAYASELKYHLARFGVDGFVAHEDIEPAKPWVDVIQAALQSCDALAALLHPGFHESNWCDQEVGYCLGRGRLVISLRLGLDPYGFIGLTQALTPSGTYVGQTAREIVAVVLSEEGTRVEMADALVNRLVKSDSYTCTRDCFELLIKHYALVTTDHLERIEAARRDNDQVRDYMKTDTYLSDLRDLVDPSPF